MIFLALGIRTYAQKAMSAANTQKAVQVMLPKIAKKKPRTIVINSTTEAHFNKLLAHFMEAPVSKKQ
jgi:hypothetical protein